MNLILHLLHTVLSLYILIVLARVIVSWCGLDPRQPAVQLLGRFTDPALDLCARIVPLRFGQFDFSPAILLVALSFLQRLIRLLLH